MRKRGLVVVVLVGKWSMGYLAKAKAGREMEGEARGERRVSRVGQVIGKGEQIARG